MLLLIFTFLNISNASADAIGGIAAVVEFKDADHEVSGYSFVNR